MRDASDRRPVLAQAVDELQISARQGDLARLFRVLGERITTNEIVGALVIVGVLLVIDGPRFDFVSGAPSTAKASP